MNPYEIAACCLAAAAVIYIVAWLAAHPEPRRHVPARPPRAPRPPWRPL